MTKRFLVVVALAFMCGAAQAQPNIRTFDFKKYLNNEIAMSTDCGKVAGGDSVYINIINYFDFDRDGKEEALVTASSCLTGTAGPDIHSVYRMDKSGKVHKMAIDESTASAKITGTPLSLIGNRNIHLGVDGGRLAYHFYDGSSRKDPMTWLFDLRKGTFRLADIVYGPVFTPSFDCRRAQTDREIAVCGNEDLAKLDLELDRVYRQLLSRAGPLQKKRLVSEQETWLRNIDKEHAYKECCAQFVNAYLGRIRELQRRTGGPTTP